MNTSTNYIALIESEKRFPTPDMLERIAAAFEIDAPALFSTKSYAKPGAGTLAAFQEQFLSDVSEAITIRFAKFEPEIPPGGIPGTDKGPAIV